MSDRKSERALVGKREKVGVKLYIAGLQQRSIRLVRNGERREKGSTRLPVFTPPHHAHPPHVP